MAKSHEAPMSFTRYVIVLEGKIELHITRDDLSESGDKVDIVTVEAGHGVFLEKGTRVSFVWPGPCK